MVVGRPQRVRAFRAESADRRRRADASATRPGCVAACADTAARYWAKEYDKDAAQAAFDTLAASGLTFIDSAEVYGFGLSEQFTGEFVRSAPGTSFQVATKFAPLPWRLTRGAVVDACRASLTRLGMQRMSLYIQHWPGFGTNGWCNDAFIEGLADCVDAGLCDAVGVSNFKAERVRSAVRALGARGVVLSSNQVQYSLLYREPERNGVLEACREAGVSVVAYSPLAQGLLTGKYTGSGAAAPSGPRAAVFTPARLAGVESLLGVMREIGQGRGVREPPCCTALPALTTRARRARRRARLPSTGACARARCRSRASRTRGRRRRWRARSGGASRQRRCVRWTRRPTRWAQWHSAHLSRSGEEYIPSAPFTTSVVRFWRHFSSSVASHSVRCAFAAGASPGATVVPMSR